MITMPLATAAAVMGPPIPGLVGSFSGVTTDTRAKVSGSLFFALRGERFDGHDFVADAVSRGACAAVVSKPMPDISAERLIHVRDVTAALAKLSTYWRFTAGPKVVALTGSNGKTTVKEMLAAIFGVHHSVTATVGNLNNHLGVPFTLCAIRLRDHFAVIEMGTSGPGEIAHLAGIAQPDVALVNNIGSAHLERLGSRVGVAYEKSAIYSGLRSSGMAIINRDDDFVDVMRDRATHCARREYSLDAGGDVHLTSLNTSQEGSRFTASIDGVEVPFELPLPGRHNVANALAAITVASALAIDDDDIRTGLASLTPVRGRLQPMAGHAGATVINDCYNANPDSLRSALDVLAGAPGRRWLALGDMGELGTGAEGLHELVGAQATERGIDELWLCGDLAMMAARRFAGEAHIFYSVEELAAALRAELADDVTVLVKASRSARFERVVEKLTEDGAC